MKYANVVTTIVLFFVGLLIFSSGLLMILSI